MLWINVLGGVTVLGGYALGLSSHPETRQDLWGGVPMSMRPLYTVSMWTATVGYLVSAGYLFFRTDHYSVRFLGNYGFGLVNALYAIALFGAALWMPLTFEMLENPSTLLWLGVRGVLAMTAVGALGLVAALASMQPRPSGALYILAVLGAAAFAFQTAVLDALVWPYWFP